MTPLREFTSGAEMMDFYRQLLKKRTRQQCMPIPEPEPEPEPEPPSPPPPDARYRLSIQRILLAVCKDFNISLAQLRERGNRRVLVVPRQIVALLAKQLTGMSSQAIGNVLGHLDHSTIIHSVSMMKKKMASDEALAARVERLRNKLLEEKPNDQCDVGRARDTGPGGPNASRPGSVAGCSVDGSGDI
jgi:hypothetical protein